MRRFTTMLIVMCCCVCAILPTNAVEITGADDSVVSFVRCVSHDMYYSEWENAELEYGYDLYGSDFSTKSGILYYVKSGNAIVGYVIVDRNGRNVVEFSRGKPAYDKVPQTLAASTRKYLYINGMPALLQGNEYIEINMSGKPLFSIDMVSGLSPMYSPQPQSKTV